MSGKEDSTSRILDAALVLCTRYGYRKVSMDDIARESGFSRPSLYNYFKNKSAIVVAATTRLHEKALTGVETALQSDGEPEEVLHRALKAWGDDFVRILYGSTHGAEVLNVSGTVAGDIAKASREKCLQLMACYFDEAHNSGALDLGSLALSPYELAQLLLFSFQGLQAGMGDVESFEARLPSLVLLFVTALRSTKEN